MSSKLYFHDTYWPIRGNKKIVVVCDRLSKHQTHRRVLLFKMHNYEIYMLLIKFFILVFYSIKQKLFPV